MFLFNSKFLLGVLVVSFSSQSFAQENMLTDAQLKKAYEQAAKNYQQNYATTPLKDTPTLPTNNNKGFSKIKPSKMLEKEQNIAMLPNKKQVFQHMVNTSNLVSLEGIHVTVDVSNASLKNVVNDIIKGSETKIGSWKVKWRLRPENQHILDSRVNLTAETTFENFMDHLLDRINNMTGVQLAVSVFDTSRIIIISDTY